MCEECSDPEIYLLHKLTQLPEILEVIFQNLNYNEKLNARLVCRTWDEEASKSIVKNYENEPCKITYPVFPPIRKVGIKPFQTLIEVSKNPKVWLPRVQIITTYFFLCKKLATHKLQQNYGALVRHFKLTVKGIFNPKMLFSILNQVPNIETLSLRFEQPEVKHPWTTSMISRYACNLKNLTGFRFTLTSTNTEEEFLDMFYDILMKIIKSPKEVMKDVLITSPHLYLVTKIVEDFRRTGLIISIPNLIIKGCLLYSSRRLMENKESPWYLKFKEMKEEFENSNETP